MSFLSSHCGGRKSILKKQFLSLTMLQLQAVTLISFMVDTCKKVKKTTTTTKKLLSGPWGLVRSPETQTCHSPPQSLSHCHFITTPGLTPNTPLAFSPLSWKKTCSDLSFPQYLFLAAQNALSLFLMSPSPLLVQKKQVDLPSAPSP